MKKKYLIAGREMSVEEIGIYALSAICIFGTFLPYYTVSLYGASQSINYISADDGVIVVILCIAVFACQWLKKYIASFVLAGISLLVVIVDYFDIYDLTEGVGKHDIGAYICLLSAIGIVACCALFYFAQKNGTSLFNTKPLSESDTIKSKSCTDNQVETVVCSKCGTKFSGGNNFCPSCGTEKPKEIKPVCKKCGATLNADDKFCVNCGTPVQSKKVCSKCGTEVSDDSAFCVNCGTKIESE